MQCVAIADIHLDKAVKAARDFDLPHRVVESEAQLHDTIQEGLLAVCREGDWLARCEAADVLIDASSAIAGGGRFALAGIETKKDVVMMNAEADLIFGPHLMRQAEKNGVVYTSCDGDQPGVIRRMIADLQMWGFDLVMAGNVKGFLDRYANPTSIEPEARKRFLDPQMCASYTDGSKLCVEMALVANAFDMECLVPGMQGPRAKHILDIPKLFDLEAVRDAGKAVVDYVLGCEPYGGVFAVGYSDSAYQKKMLGWFPACLSEGPFYVFRRPYHLIHIEAMQCVAEAHLDRQALLQPRFGFKTNVYSYAKKDLRAGDKLDGLGGYACYGMIENCADNRARPGVPSCLAEDVTVNRDIAKDEKIFMDDIVYDTNRFDFELYSLAAKDADTVTS
jgi:predicted homoserine dehydrogenase-like protein